MQDPADSVSRYRVGSGGEDVTGAGTRRRDESASDAAAPRAKRRRGRTKAGNEAPHVFLGRHVQRDGASSERSTAAGLTRLQPCCEASKHMLVVRQRSEGMKAAIRLFTDDQAHNKGASKARAREALRRELVALDLALDALLTHLPMQAAVRAAAQPRVPLPALLRAGTDPAAEHAFRGLASCQLRVAGGAHALHQASDVAHEADALMYASQTLAAVTGPVGRAANQTAMLQPTTGGAIAADWSCAHVMLPGILAAPRLIDHTLWRLASCPDRRFSVLAVRVVASIIAGVWASTAPGAYIDARTLPDITPADVAWQPQTPLPDGQFLLVIGVDVPMTEQEQERHGRQDDSADSNAAYPAGVQRVGAADLTSAAAAAAPIALAQLMQQCQQGSAPLGDWTLLRQHGVWAYRSTTVLAGPVVEAESIARLVRRVDNAVAALLPHHGIWETYAVLKHVLAAWQVAPPAQPLQPSQPLLDDVFRDGPTSMAQLGLWEAFFFSRALRVLALSPSQLQRQLIVYQCLSHTTPPRPAAAVAGDADVAAPALGDGLRPAQRTAVLANLARGVRYRWFLRCRETAVNVYAAVSQLTALIQADAASVALPADAVLVYFVPDEFANRHEVDVVLAQAGDLVQGFRFLSSTTDAAAEEWIPRLDGDEADQTLGIVRRYCDNLVPLSLDMDTSSQNHAMLADDAVHPLLSQLATPPSYSPPPPPPPPPPHSQPIP